jgi:hypothetical protein
MPARWHDAGDGLSRDRGMHDERAGLDEGAQHPHFIEKSLNADGNVF